MATIITSECINCGACESECPNTAIYQGGVEWEVNGITHPPIATEMFYIAPDKCTECVGFFDHEACAAVCPVDCCIPDPNNPEAEDVLLARSKRLHPDRAFGDNFPSRFRKAGAAAAAPAAKPEAATAPPVPTPAAAATASKPTAAAPRENAAEAAPPAAKAAAPSPSPAAGAAQPATSSAQPAAAPAPPPPVAQPAAEASPHMPNIDEWEIPIECFRCHGTYTVPCRHFRSGHVLYCPSCHGSYVVTTALYGRVSRAVREFDARWRQEFDRFQAERRRQLQEFEERQRAQLQAFSESLKNVSREFRPPGAPRKRAGIFG